MDATREDRENKDENGKSRELFPFVVIAGAIVSMVPAVRAYRLSLADGMMVRT